MKNIYIFLADGFETIEALTVADVLRRGGCDVKTVSIMNKIDVMSSHNISVKADMLLKDANLDDCDMMILPGGGAGTQNIKNNTVLTKALIKQAEAGKYVCAICAAPSALGVNGILKGKKATVYPGFESELLGANVTGENVVKDGNIVTAKGPGMAMEFAFALLKIAKNAETAAQVKAGMLLK